jgi:hypothetical protein
MKVSKTSTTPSSVTQVLLDAEHTLTQLFERIREQLPAENQRDDDFLLVGGSALLQARCRLREGVNEVLALRWRGEAA